MDKRVLVIEAVMPAVNLPTWGESAAILAATAAFIASLRNGTKNDALKAEMEKVKASVVEIHLSLNSRLSQLVTAANAQGRQDERDSHSVTVEGVPKVDEGK